MDRKSSKGLWLFPPRYAADDSENRAGLDYDDVPEEESEDGATEDFASNEEGGRNDSVVFPTGNILQDLFKAGLLGNYESRHDLLPLVDLWFDLSEAIKQEDIPVPVDLFAERDAVLRSVLIPCMTTLSDRSITHFC